MQVEKKICDIRDLLRFHSEIVLGIPKTSDIKRKIAEKRNDLLYGYDWKFLNESFQPTADFNGESQTRGVSLEEDVKIKSVGMHDFDTMSAELRLSEEEKAIFIDYLSWQKGEDRSLGTNAEGQSKLFELLQKVAERVGIPVQSIVKKYGLDFSDTGKSGSSVEDIQAKLNNESVRRQEKALFARKHYFALGKPNPKMEPTTIARHRVGYSMTHEQADGAMCNPSVASEDEEYIDENNELRVRSYKSNCATCVLVYELRRRGYDVKARPRDYYKKYPERLPTSSKDLTAFVGANPSSPYYDGKGEVVKAISNARANTPKKARLWLENTVKEGERYIIRVSWIYPNMSHVAIVERENGVMFIYDPQKATHCIEKNEIEAWFRKVNLNADEVEYAMWILKCNDARIDETILNSLLEV